MNIKKVQRKIGAGINDGTIVEVKSGGSSPVDSGEYFLSGEEFIITL